MRSIWLTCSLIVAASILGFSANTKQFALTIEQKARILQLQRDYMLMQAELAPALNKLREKGEELNRAIKEVQVAGWQLNPQTLEYMRVEKGGKSE